MKKTLSLFLLLFLLAGCGKDHFETNITKKELIDASQKLKEEIRGEKKESPEENKSQKEPTSKEGEVIEYIIVEPEEKDLMIESIRTGKSLRELKALKKDTKKKYPPSPGAQGIHPGGINPPNQPEVKNWDPHEGERNEEPSYTPPSEPRHRPESPTPPAPVTPYYPPNHQEEEDPVEPAPWQDPVEPYEP